MNTKTKKQTTTTELATVAETFNLQPSTCNEPPALRENQASLSISIQSAPAEPSVPCIAELPSLTHRRVRPGHIRNGKIARLPKLYRDMVNRMLYNNIPYRKIVDALDELGIHATERNVSNWKTLGGYKEWRDEQEHQLALSHLQDHLTDYLRKNNATQLPEVGLQVASTQLSMTLLQPDAARQLAADPQKYRQVVEMLCRLSTHINALQKDREKAVNKAAIRDTSECVRREEEKETEITRRTYSSTLGERPGEDTPHRNDLPKRDELPFRDAPLPSPSIADLMEVMRSNKKP